MRYYGGTKLGKPGLIEAYGTSAEECLQKATFSKIAQVDIVEVKYAYNQENIINKLELNYSLVEQEAEYLAGIRKVYACKTDNVIAFYEELDGLAHLDIQYRRIEQSFIPV